MSRLNFRTSSLLAALPLVIGGCSGDAGPPTEAPPQATTKAEGLSTELARLGGTYVWNSEMKAYVFSNKEAIETLVGPGTEETIGELVECLDDSAPSRTLLNGQPVPVGVVCYQALRQIIYYEPTDSDGDVARTWPGHITPMATSEDLRAAKLAWQDVGRKAYRPL